MGIKEQFFAQVGAAIGNRAYPNAAPQGVALPYLTFFRVAGTRQTAMNGAVMLQNTRFQVDIYAGDADAVDAAAVSVKAALDAWSMRSVINLEQDFYETDTGLHRIMLDVSVWHS